VTPTYDENLDTDLDWVRFLTWDTDIVTAGKPRNSDEEITAVLAEEALEGHTGLSAKWFAAATILCADLGFWASRGEGLEEKRVDEVVNVFGMEGQTNETVESTIKKYRRRGIHLLTPRPRIFEAVPQVEDRGTIRVF
jgi:hypothetical protein